MGCAPSITLSICSGVKWIHIEYQSIMYLCLPGKGNGVMIYYYYLLVEVVANIRWNFETVKYGGF